MTEKRSSIFGSAELHTMPPNRDDGREPSPEGLSPRLQGQLEELAQAEEWTPARVGPQHEAWRKSLVSRDLSKGGIVLGYRVKQATLPYPPEAIDYSQLLRVEITAHSTVIGTTGFGKGIGFSIPLQFSFPGALVQLDLKGENAWAAADYRREALGQDVWILDPTDYIKKNYKDGKPPLETHRYNPLLDVEVDGEDYEADLLAIAHLAVPSDPKEQQIWPDGGRNLKLGLTDYVVRCMPKKQRTVATVRALLGLGMAGLRKFITDVIAQAQTKQFRAQYGEKPLFLEHLTQYASVQRIKPKRRKAEGGGKPQSRDAPFEPVSLESDGHRSTAYTRTSKLDFGPLRDVMERSDFSFHDLKKKPATVYIVMDPGRLPEYEPWLKFMATLAVRILSRGERPAHKILFSCDEASALGKMESVANGYLVLREIKLHFNLTFQSYGDIRRIWGADTPLLENLQFQLVMGDDQGHSTPEYVSKWIGKKDVWYVTRNASTGESEQENEGWSESFTNTEGTTRTHTVGTTQTKANSFGTNYTIKNESPFVKSSVGGNQGVNFSTAENVSLADGETWSRAHQRGRSGGRSRGTQKTRGVTEHVTGRDVITEDEFRRMPKNMALLLMGGKAHVIEKCIYFNDAAFEGFYRARPDKPPSVATIGLMPDLLPRAVPPPPPPLPPEPMSLRERSSRAWSVTGHAVAAVMVLALIVLPAISIALTAAHNGAAAAYAWVVDPFVEDEGERAVRLAEEARQAQEDRAREAEQEAERERWRKAQEYADRMEQLARAPSVESEAPAPPHESAPVVEAVVTPVERPRRAKRVVKARIIDPCRDSVTGQPLYARGGLHAFGGVPICGGG